MRPALVAKKELVKEILSQIKDSKAFIVVEYHHLSVEDLTKLRRELMKLNASISIFKNRLVKIATKEAGKEALSEFLTGPNAFVITNEDPIAIPKELANFAKTHPKLQLRAAIYEGEVLNTEQIKEIALLPSKDELLAMFASSLTYPLRMFAIACKEIANQKEA